MQMDKELLMDQEEPCSNPDKCS